MVGKEMSTILFHFPVALPFQIHCRLHPWLAVPGKVKWNLACDSGFQVFPTSTAVGVGVMESAHVTVQRSLWERPLGACPAGETAAFGSHWLKLLGSPSFPARSTFLDLKETSWGLFNLYIFVSLREISRHVEGGNVLSRFPPTSGVWMGARAPRHKVPCYPDPSVQALERRWWQVWTKPSECSWLGFHLCGKMQGSTGVGRYLWSQAMWAGVPEGVEKPWWQQDSVEHIRSGVTHPNSHPSLCHLHDLVITGKFPTSLSLSFHLEKMGIMVPSHWFVVRIKWEYLLSAWPTPIGRYCHWGAP